MHPKGWGEEIWYHNEADYCFKGLKFKPNGRSSLHFHIRKHETWVVVRGRFTIELVQPANGNRLKNLVRPGDFQSIPPGLPHRLICTSRNGGLILEASTQHFEDDSHRLEPGDSQASSLCYPEPYQRVHRIARTTRRLYPLLDQHAKKFA